MFDFEQFPVYQKAESYYAFVIQILANPKIDKNLKDQWKRASLSIVLNIAEGAGKYTKLDKKNFYVVAKGSVNECVAIMRILKIEGILEEKAFQMGYMLLLDIAKMLSALINTMMKR